MPTEDNNPTTLPALQAAKTPANTEPYMAPQTWFDASDDDQGVELSDYLHSLRRKWLPGLGLGFLIASIVAVILWIAIPINYEAFMAFQVSEGSDNFLIGSSRRAYQWKEHEVFKATQAEQIKGTHVVEAALRKPGIMQLKMVAREKDRPKAWLANELQARYLGKESDILRVSVHGQSLRGYYQAFGGGPGGLHGRGGLRGSQE